MKDLSGKKLLVLGNTYSTVGVVKLAHRLGLDVTVVGKEPDGDAVAFADHSAIISTNDYDSLLEFIRKEHIDGVMTGASEMNILNMLRLCKKANLPVYATEEQWDICQDKALFKQLCRQYNVPVIPEFEVGSELKDTDFPVIVKPADGCSARGISICHNNQELREAEQKAISLSPTGRILIEHYIQNGGQTMSAKYIVVNGEFYPEIISDRYVMDNGTVTAYVQYPSKNIDRHMRLVDPFIKQMFKSIGFTNGVFSLQEIPEGDNVYLHEMCLRVTGGMVYKITDAAGSGNALAMLMHYAITGEMCEKADIESIDPNMHGKCAATLSIPLRLGKIDQIEGMDEIQNMKHVVDITTYYHLGDEITTDQLNSLDQLFARIIVVADNESGLFSVLDKIRTTLSIKDVGGQDLIIWDTYDRIASERRKNA